MTKSLEQIQQENRKFILGALEGVDGSLSKDLFNSKPLTLSRVLLALLKADKPVGATLAINKSGFYINLRSDMPWDIKFETLEEQSEETQREINDFFNN